MKEMMKDPNFAQMFGDANGGNLDADADEFKNFAKNAATKNDDGTVDAETV